MIFYKLTIENYFVPLFDHVNQLFFRVAKPRYIKFFGHKKFYSGFTLLEILVSLAVLATAFAAVLQLHSASMEMIISGRAHTKAVELAQYKMTEIEITGLKKLPFMSGDFGNDAPDYSWDITLEPAPIPAWTKVIVTVRNKNIGEGGSFQLIEYILSEPLKTIAKP